MTDSKKTEVKEPLLDTSFSIHAGRTSYYNLMGCKSAHQLQYRYRTI